jgi:hypothetical protein
MYDCEGLQDLVEGETAGESADRNRLRLRAVKFTSTLQLEAAVLALRMIEGACWHSRLLSHAGLRDTDILALLGLDADDSYGC